MQLWLYSVDTEMIFRKLLCRSNVIIQKKHTKLPSNTKADVCFSFGKMLVKSFSQCHHMFISKQYFLDKIKGRKKGCLRCVTSTSIYLINLTK